MVIGLPGTEMESSQVVGSSEKYCSDSESGWTMYIGSQIRQDDKEDDENDNKNKSSSHENDDEGDDESDDSMASDASSGPILHDYELGTKEGSQLLGLQRNKKPCKQEKKSDHRTTKRVEKQQSRVRKAESAASQV